MFTWLKLVHFPLAFNARNLLRVFPSLIHSSLSRVIYLLTRHFLFFRCKCGNCSVDSLQNISECCCCSELEGCLEAMQSDLVLQDLSPDVNLTCVTEHPGFKPVCLQKWSLRLAAGKYKTKGKQKYRQTRSEERWVKPSTAGVIIDTYKWQFPFIYEVMPKS